MTDHGWARWISLGADATNVKIAEVFFSQSNAGFGAIAVPWRAYVTDTSF
jgi:hypothetical protein